MMSLLKFLWIKKTHVFWFFVINLFFGAMGVWAPLLSSNGSIRTNFIGVLDAGGLYTFACAYLAAAGGYIVFEYLSGKDANYKSCKATFIGFALILIVLSGLIVGKKIDNSVTQSTNESIDTVQVYLTLISLLVGFALGVIQFYSENGMNSVVDNNKQEARNSVKSLFENKNT